MKKNQITSGSGAPRRPHIFRPSFFSIARAVGLAFVFAACTDPPPPPPQPCEGNQNEWSASLTIRDDDSFDFDMPLFRSGAPVHYELSLSPMEWNQCPELHRVRVQLIQHYSPAVLETSTRVADLIWNEVIDATGPLEFQESFVPPSGTGTYAIEATGLDEQGIVILSRRSEFFHVQQFIHPLRPVFIAVYSPYHGQSVQQGAPLHYTFLIEAVSGDIFKYSVKLLDENGEVVHTIDEETDINVLDANQSGPINTNIPGRYTLRATTWYLDPVTFLLSQNVAYNEFTIED